ncbi:hypothetical protein LTR17_010384 [Elasticomyces elasticus]|nr:hypothetical protein LTR17_010384 [Elasticomyces elasticus]
MADNASATGVPKVCGVCGTGGDLFRCSCCKCVNYCSKPCQAEDWPVHKKMCKILADREGTKYGALLGVKRYEGNHPATLVWLKNSTLDGTPEYQYTPGYLKNGTSHFQDLPITRALGFPLCYGGDLTGLKQIENRAVTYLTLNIDTTSAKFGEVGRPMGGACLARHDGRHINVLHVEALVNYAEAACQEIGRVPDREDTGEKVDREEMVKRLLTPMAFAKAFEKFRQRKVMSGEVWWVDLECPVVVEDDGNGEATGRISFVMVP